MSTQLIRNEDLPTSQERSLIDKLLESYAVDKPDTHQVKILRKYVQDTWDRKTATLVSESAKEIEHWKWVAAYLASCHAATLESLPKSASYSLRRRLARICLDSVQFLRGIKSPDWFGQCSKDQAIEVDIDRCLKTAKKNWPVGEAFQ